MNFKKTLVSATLAGSLGLSGIATAADVVIGVPNWPSVAANANVLKVVIEENLGLEVELQNASHALREPNGMRCSKHRAHDSSDGYGTMKICH